MASLLALNELSCFQLASTVLNVLTQKAGDHPCELLPPFHREERFPCEL